ncbi:hypothetical protein A2U01_0059052, partial [Trifolium medium]|nr:hypothetical protein [Trifolium medium]
MHSSSRYHFPPYQSSSPSSLVTSNPPEKPFSSARSEQWCRLWGDFP